MDTIIWGCTGHFRVVHEIIKKKRFRIVAFFDLDVNLNSPIQDVPIFHQLDDLKLFVHILNSPIIYSIVCIGGDRGQDRVNYIHVAEDLGSRIPSVIHKSSIVAENTVIGKGSHILANAHLGVGSTVGMACILNSSCSVDHDCILGDGVHIAPGSILAGHVQVGSFTTIYSGSIVGPRVRIGENVIIGAGSIVLGDVSTNSKIYGFHK